MMSLGRSAAHSRRLHRNNIWDDLIIAFVVLMMVLCVYPFWYVLIGSFSNGADYMRGGVYLLPRKWSLENYIVTLADSRLYTGFRVTILRTVICTVTNVLFTAVVAYGMSRNDLPFRKTIYMINMFTMFFGGGLIPFYMLLKQLKLINTFWVYVIPGLYSVYNMLICSSYSAACRRSCMSPPLWTAPASSASSGSCTCPCPRRCWPPLRCGWPWATGMISTAAWSTPPAPTCKRCSCTCTR